VALCNFIYCHNYLGGDYARTFRAVAVGYPHQVTQRGNNREQVFFDDQDR